MLNVPRLPVDLSAVTLCRRKLFLNVGGLFTPTLFVGDALVRRTQKDLFFEQTPNPLDTFNLVHN